MTDDGGNPQEFVYEYDTETSASIAIVRAICAIENVEPIELPETLGSSLYDVIDPDALDTMVQDARNEDEVLIEFHYDRYHVTVSSERRIRLRWCESNE